MTVAEEKRVGSLAECVEYVRSEGESLFAVIDAARDRQLGWIAHTEATTRPLSLFNPPGARCLAQVAPYLAPIDPAGPLFAAWEQRLGGSVGLLLLTHVTMRELRAHLRSIFVAVDSRQQECFFRFYDPRVLRTYLGQCTPKEGAAFFGPIRRILCDGAAGGHVLSYSLGRGGVEARSLVVAPAARSAG